MSGVDDGRAPPAALVVNEVGHLSIPTTQEQSIQLQEVCSPVHEPGAGAAGEPHGVAAWQLHASNFHCSNPGNEASMMSSMLQIST